MKKKNYYLIFPMASATIEVNATPFAIKDIAQTYVRNQCEVFGDICIIAESKDTATPIGIVYCNSLYVKDDATEGIPAVNLEEKK